MLIFERYLQGGVQKRRLAKNRSKWAQLTHRASKEVDGIFYTSNLYYSHHHHYDSLTKKCLITIKYYVLFQGTKNCTFTDYR